jgi:hypothetical protein
MKIMLHGITHDSNKCNNPSKLLHKATRGALPNQAQGPFQEQAIANFLFNGLG